MSYGSTVHRSIEQRRGAGAALAATATERRRKVADALKTHMPELVDDAGEVCPFAVWAAMRLEAAGERVTPNAVLARRAAHQLPGLPATTLGDAERAGAITRPGTNHDQGGTSS